MQTKYKLPADVKLECIAYVRGYARRVNEYNRKREDILNAIRSPVYDATRVDGGAMSDSTFERAAKLQALETHFDTKVTRAVEQAKNLIGVDIASEHERQNLVQAVWDCCIYGRQFVFRYYTVCVCKSEFYNRRSKFLYNIHEYLKK